ncbi:MAG: hypothetical protein LBS37_01950, partial [Treponema sp.]|nr:hypothetical protein [Treponema sp.]
MPHFEMLPKAMDASFRKCYQTLFLPMRLNTVHLGEPLTQPENSLIDIVLKQHRIVQSALGLQGVLVRRWQGSAFKEPLEGAPRLIVDFDFPGANPGFTFEFLGR